MIKHQIFVNKYLPVRTPRYKHYQRIFDLFRLINKDTTINNKYTILALLLSSFGMILLCISVLLLLIPHAKWYNVHRCRDSKHSTVPFRTLEYTISWEFSENRKSTIFQKPLWMVTLS